MLRGRLRVLMVPAWYPSPESPTSGLFMQDLARAIATRHDIVVLTSVGEPGLEEGDRPRVRTLRLMPRGAGLLSDLARLRVLNTTVSSLRREGWQPDLIHAHVFVRGLPAVLVGRCRRLPVVITENYSGLLTNAVTGWNARIARFTYRHAELVCPDSPLQEQRLMRLEPRARYQVVPEVVDVDWFRRTPRGPRPLAAGRVLAVCHLTRRKGLHDLIEAIRLLTSAGREVTLTIVGDGPERTALEAQAAGLPVVFLGALPREDVAACVGEADVFAMPTLADPFGIAPVEALAAGIRVVITDAAGSADLIAAYGGIVVPAADPATLAAALAEALDHPDAVPAETADALDRLCGPEAIARSYDEIYRRVVEQHTARVQ